MAVLSGVSWWHGSAPSVPELGHGFRAASVDTADADRSPGGASQRRTKRNHGYYRQLSVLVNATEPFKRGLLSSEQHGKN